MPLEALTPQEVRDQIARQRLQTGALTLVLLELAAEIGATLGRESRANLSTLIRARLAAQDSQLANQDLPAGSTEWLAQIANAFAEALERRPAPPSPD